MIFRQLQDGTSSTWTYVLGCERTKEAVIIDPVFEQAERDLALLRELGLKLTHILETHVHADHVTAAWRLQQATWAKVVIAEASGAKGADYYVRDGDVIHFGEQKLEVRATPGHTSGCVTYVLGDKSKAFTGDALLIRGAGRTDFQQGSAETLYRSIHRQIFSLPEECLLYPAHDYNGRTVSSVAEERAYNPRVGGEASVGDFVGYMDNLGLAHPKKIDIAVPANLKLGKPEDLTPYTTPSWAPVVVTFAGIPELSAEWLSTHLDRVSVLDVRESDERSGELGSIPGTLHIPLGELAARVDEVPQDRPVVTVCRSGKRSAQGLVILRKAGRKELANLSGGMLYWNALGLPLA